MKIKNILKHSEGVPGGELITFFVQKASAEGRIFRRRREA